MSDDLLTTLRALARGGEREATVPTGGPTNATQARIVSAALELFAERSYDAATTLAIAQRAGVTEKTLFRHFGSKEALFKRTVYPALFQLLEPIAVAELREMLRQRPPGFRETVRAIVADRVAFGVKHPAVIKMVMQEAWLRPAFREGMAAFFTERMWPTLSTVFDEARAAGELRDVPSPVALRTLISVVAGYLFTRTVLFPDLAWDDAAAIDELTGVILDGLAAKPGG